MLSVLLIWLYIAVTAFLAGYGFLKFCAGKFFLSETWRVGHLDTYCLCGLACVTVYAQFFSLIDKVGLAANFALCAVCALIFWKDRHGLAAVFSGFVQKAKSERIRMAAIFFLFLLFAYGTSRGMIHYDTSLYHAQSIRWLEEYGVVKGIGNLHCRLAYNSSSFALSALYSMSFLGGQSYHCAAGFLAFLLAKICLEMVDSFRRRRLRIADFARVACIYYLVIIFDEMISPASDFFLVLLIFYMVIRWLDLLEREEHAVMPYALLCVMGVFVMTVKLSAALILLLVIYPAFYLLRDRRWRDIGFCLASGIAAALPYFIRNVLISGWLVYPFTQIDLFHTAWKVPKGLADYDAREIQVWGRGYTDVSRYDIGIDEWFGGWFQALANSDKLLVLLAFVSLVCLLFYFAGMLLGLWRRRWDVLLVQATVGASFVFWLCTSPLIRYGCVYVYLTSAVILGGIYDAGRSFFVKQRIETVCMAAVLLLILYKTFALGREIAASFTNDYWIVQKDYENFEVESYEIEGVVFYYPVTGDQVGYESFPSSPVKAEIGFLGDGIEEGFYSLQP